MGDGNHPNPHQSTIRKENKDARSYPGPLPELLTQVTTPSAQECLLPSLWRIQSPHAGQQVTWPATKGQGPTDTAGEKPGTLQGTPTLFNIEIPASRCAIYFYTFAQHASDPAPTIGQERLKQEPSSLIAGIRVQVLYNHFRAVVALPARGANLTVSCCQSKAAIIRQCRPSPRDKKK